MTHIIRFPIGDWSDDGHGKCEYFMVKSNMSVESLRELHFKAPEVIGFDIGKMCSEYEESTLDPDIIKKLIAIGIDPQTYELTGELAVEECWMDEEKLIDIWLDVLKYIDKTIAGTTNDVDNIKVGVTPIWLELDRIKKPDYEDINFYGMDEKNRHLDTPGYGVFYS